MNDSIFPILSKLGFIVTEKTIKKVNYVVVSKDGTEVKIKITSMPSESDALKAWLDEYSYNIRSESVNAPRHGW